MIIIIKRTHIYTYLSPDCASLSSWISAMSVALESSEATVLTNSSSTFKKTDINSAAALNSWTSDASPTLSLISLIFKFLFGSLMLTFFGLPKTNGFNYVVPSI